MTTCINTEANFTCSDCPEGFVGTGRTECKDFDECAAENGGCDAHSLCTNYIGGRYCGPCPAHTYGTGYTSCLDIDECLTNNGDCDFLTDCVNIYSSSNCTACPEGYVGSGQEGCVDIDECSMGMNGGCSMEPFVTCTNKAPGVTCGACPFGYRGDGIGAGGCRKSANCTVDNGGCDLLSSCLDSPDGTGPICGECPDGYSGTGATSCKEIDGCAVGPCYTPDLCTDIPAPGIGYLCADCPVGMVGNGVSCEPDKCTTGEACSALVLCTTTPGGGYTCDPCPEGFDGDAIGTEGCQDVDECAIARGGCDMLVDCVNIVGSYYCTNCPEGYRGSGEPQRCLPKTECRVDNGGCDELVTCEDSAEDGYAVCGPCPAGYVGSGDAGCVDEDGCSVRGASCYENNAEELYVPCQDVPPPGTGYTCGDCPVGYYGNGRECYTNACFNFNGGCDPRVECVNDLSEASGRKCGTCPAGTVDTYRDGTSCDDEDGCAAEPCFPGVECTDVVAPGTGRTCAACPPGYAATGAEWCVDVDECATADAGGCWYLSEEVHTACVNRETSSEYPAGYECTACPDGFKGSGSSGCFPSSTCAEDNGGCWVGTGELEGFTTTCVDTAFGPACGECPEGYAGTGDSGCFDFDACAELPCFPGVACTDAKAPAQGYACDRCPEGYHGDGESCTMCSIRVSIVDSTVVDGKERRAGWYKGERMLIVGQLDGLNNPNCTNTLGISYQWAGARSDETTVILDDTRNKANTLRLSIPKMDLTVGLSYTFRLSAQMRGAPRVLNFAELEFYVESQPLVVTIAGGNVVTGDRNAVTLDVSESIDPDGEPGDIAFRWACARDDNAGPCRYNDGALMATRLFGPNVTMKLEGDWDVPINYTFSVMAVKGVRSTSKSTRVTVMGGGPPVVAITPPLSKANANEKLTLPSVISAVDPEGVQLEWTVGMPTGCGNCSALDLPTAISSTDVHQEALVIAPGQLVAGAVYQFQLRAVDEIGEGTALVEVQVNTPPAGGRLQMEPSEGVALSTVFYFRSLDWQDEDLPLWYKYSYNVVGSGADDVMLIEFSPLPPPLYEYANLLAEPGLQAWGRAVTCIATVQDALGGTVSSAVNVTVDTASAEEEAAMMGSLAESAEADLLNGDSDSAMIRIDGFAALLNSESTEATRRLRRLLQEEGSDEEAAAALEERQAERDQLLGMVSSTREMLFSTSSSVERLSLSAARLVAEPGEVAAGTQNSTVQLLGGILADTTADTAPAPLTAAAAGALCSGLSSLTLAVGVNDTNGTAARAAEVQALMGSMAASLLQSASAGEKPQEVLSDTLAMAAQRSDAMRQISPLSAPGSSTTVAFPGSLGQALAGSTCGNATTACNTTAAAGNSTAEASKRASLQVDTRLVASKSDQHVGTVGTGDLVGSDVTTIELTGGDGEVLSVNGLEEGITFELALEAGAAGTFQGTMRCTFWDEGSQAYSTEGCVALPNPAPAGADLDWKSLVVGDFLWGLGEMWAVGNDTMAAGCVEEYAALDPVYEGTDVGLRKYVANKTAGAECQLANTNNPWGCWWVWTQGIFEGPGCVQASELSCLCTHLTDFKAEQELNPTALMPPEVKTLEADDMLNISLEDLLKSGVLLTLVGSIIGGGVYLAVASIGAHKEMRQTLLAQLVLEFGTGVHTFQRRTLGPGRTIWTWCLFEESRQAGVQQVSLKLKRQQRGLIKEKVADIQRMLEGAGARVDFARLQTGILTSADAGSDSGMDDQAVAERAAPPLFFGSTWAGSGLSGEQSARNAPVMRVPEGARKSVQKSGTRAADELNHKMDLGSPSLMRPQVSSTTSGATTQSGPVSEGAEGRCSEGKAGSATPLRASWWRLWANTSSVEGAQRPRRPVGRSGDGLMRAAGVAEGRGEGYGGAVSLRELHAQLAGEPGGAMLGDAAERGMAAGGDAANAAGLHRQPLVEAFEAKASPVLRSPMSTGDESGAAGEGTRGSQRKGPVPGKSGAKSKWQAAVKGVVPAKEESGWNMGGTGGTSTSKWKTEVERAKGLVEGGAAKKPAASPYAVPTIAPVRRARHRRSEKSAQEGGVEQQATAAAYGAAGGSAARSTLDATKLPQKLKGKILEHHADTELSCDADVDPAAPRGGAGEARVSPRTGTMGLAGKASAAPKHKAAGAWKKAAATVKAAATMKKAASPLVSPLVPKRAAGGKAAGGKASGLATPRGFGNVKIVLGGNGQKSKYNAGPGGRKAAPASSPGAESTSPLGRGASTARAAPLLPMQEPQAPGPELANAAGGGANQAVMAVPPATGKLVSSPQGSSVVGAGPSGLSTWPAVAPPTEAEAGQRCSGNDSKNGACAGGGDSVESASSNADARLVGGVEEAVATGSTVSPGGTGREVAAPQCGGGEDSGTEPPSSDGSAGRAPGFADEQQTPQEPGGAGVDSPGGAGVDSPEARSPAGKAVVSESQAADPEEQEMGTDGAAAALEPARQIGSANLTVDPAMLEGNATALERRFPIGGAPPTPQTPDTLHVGTPRGGEPQAEAGGRGVYDALGDTSHAWFTPAADSRAAATSPLGPPRTTTEQAAQGPAGPAGLWGSGVGGANLRPGTAPMPGDTVGLDPHQAPLELDAGFRPTTAPTEGDASSLPSVLAFSRDPKQDPTVRLTGPSESSRPGSAARSRPGSAARSRPGSAALDQLVESSLDQTGGPEHAGGPMGSSNVVEVMRAGETGMVNVKLLSPSSRPRSAGRPQAPGMADPSGDGPAARNSGTQQAARSAKAEAQAGLPRSAMAGLPPLAKESLQGLVVQRQKEAAALEAPLDPALVHEAGVGSRLGDDPAGDTAENPGAGARWQDAVAKTQVEGGRGSATADFRQLTRSLMRYVEQAVEDPRMAATASPMGWAIDHIADQAEAGPAREEMETASQEPKESGGAKDDKAEDELNDEGDCSVAVDPMTPPSAAAAREPRGRFGKLVSGALTLLGFYKQAKAEAQAEPRGEEGHQELQAAATALAGEAECAADALEEGEDGVEEEQEWGLMEMNGQAVGSFLQLASRLEDYVHMHSGQVKADGTPALPADTPSAWTWGAAVPVPGPEDATLEQAECATAVEMGAAEAESSPPSNGQVLEEEELEELRQLRAKLSEEVDSDADMGKLLNALSRAAVKLKEHKLDHLVNSSAAARADSPLPDDLDLSVAVVDRGGGGPTEHAAQADGGDLVDEEPARGAEDMDIARLTRRLAMQGREIKPTEEERLDELEREAMERALATEAAAREERRRAEESQIEERLNAAGAAEAEATAARKALEAQLFAREEEQERLKEKHDLNAGTAVRKAALVLRFSRMLPTGVQRQVQGVLRERMQRLNKSQRNLAAPGDVAEHQLVSKAKKRRMAVRLVAFSRLVTLLRKVQDLRVSERLCDLLGLSITGVNLSMPVEEMRLMSLQYHLTEWADMEMDEVLREAYRGRGVEEVGWLEQGEKDSGVLRVSRIEKLRRKSLMQTFGAQAVAESVDGARPLSGSRGLREPSPPAVPKTAQAAATPDLPAFQSITPGPSMLEAEAPGDPQQDTVSPTQLKSQAGRSKRLLLTKDRNLKQADWKERHQVAGPVVYDGEGGKVVLSSMERLLGTALVMAFLEIKGLITRGQVRSQLRLMQEAAWEYPNSRRFFWYVDTFKVLLASQGRQGWYYRTLLWRLIFLQQSDGSFEISPALASVLHAGDADPKDISLTAETEIGEGELRASVPRQLWAALPSLEGEELLQRVEKVWATLCAIERYKTMPFGWEVNPAARPLQRRSLQQVAEGFLEREAKLSPELADMLPSLREDALKHVKDWSKRRLEGIKALRERTLKEHARVRAEQLADMTYLERRNELRGSFKKFVHMAMLAHPWAAIAAASCLEPHTQAQRILVQCNSILLMLTVTLALYFSKAATCCIALKQHLGCPEPVTESSECFGYTTCIELLEDERHDEARADFVCEAFPQEDLQGKLWATVHHDRHHAPREHALEACSRREETTPVPKNWTPGMNRKILESASGPGGEHAGAMRSGPQRHLENLLFLIFVVFLNPRLISRALARYLVMLAHSVEGLVEYLVWMVERVQRTWHTFCEAIRFLYRLKVKGDSIANMVSEAEVKEVLAADRKAAEDAALATFSRARSELDSTYIQFCYFLLAVFWAASVWIMIAYAVLIRLMLGSDAETKVLVQWITALLLDNLGVQVVQAVTIKIWVQKLLERMQNYAKDEAGVIGWYERYIAQHLNLKFMPGMEDYAEAEYDAAGLSF
ncbi:hypothetical protein CYMTET_4735 [Cymbomonas tetramitiformis]|uniref:EGF-like domain-containing protein n=1 Tax=Cymbomonas tetramitiformis TaxID=36881 RepID=A0AAE0H2H7_9CHLO|nr:hypothetical protein CYMTET_4735 [Cymbomonas tetramitiformis]